MEGKVSEFSDSFGLQSHPLALTASLCPTGVVSQAWACTIYDLVSLDLARAHVSPPPLVHGLRFSSAGAVDSPGSSCHSLTSVVTCCIKLSRGPMATLSLGLNSQEPRVVRKAQLSGFPPSTHAMVSSSLQDCFYACLVQCHQILKGQR